MEPGGFGESEVQKDLPLFKRFLSGEIVSIMWADTYNKHLRVSADKRTLKWTSQLVYQLDRIQTLFLAFSL